MTVAGARDLRRALSQFRHGEPFTCVANGGSQQEILCGTFPEFVPEPIYQRKNKTAQVDCRLTSSEPTQIAIASANGTRLRVWLPEGQASKAQFKSSVALAKIKSKNPFRQVVDCERIVTSICEQSVDYSARPMRGNPVLGIQECSRSQKKRCSGFSR